VVSANIKALSPLIIFYDGESFLEGNTISVEACSSVDKNSNDKRLLSSIYGGKYAKAFYKGSQFQLQLFYDKMILMLERMGLKHFKGLYIEYLLSFFHTKSFDDIVCNLYVQIDD
jgi:effector-binding domain-containing protein